jgi:hypothetical protein
MTNLVSTTARVFTDRGRENIFDDVHRFAGEEMQWWIYVAVTYCTPPLNVIQYVGLHIITLNKQKVF